MLEISRGLTAAASGECDQQISECFNSDKRSLVKKEKDGSTTVNSAIGALKSQQCREFEQILQHKLMTTLA